jgi:chloramphenicol-sensitive protein RarD
VGTDESSAETSAGVLYALGAYGMWGLAPAYWKELDGIGAPEILAHRVLWSMGVGVLLVLFLRALPQVRAVLRSRNHALPLLASAALIGTNWLVFIWAVETDRVLDTSLGYYINPLINVLFGTALLGERLRPAQIAAVALAAVGVAQMVVALGELPWIALVLATTFGLYGLVRKLAPATPVVGFSLETLLLSPLAAVFLYGLHAAGESAAVEASLRAKLFLAGSGLFTAGPLLCFNSAAKRLRLSTLGLFQFIAPSMAFLLAVVAYDEPFTRVHLVTFGCVWTALAIYLIDSARASRGT